MEVRARLVPLASIRRYLDRFNVSTQVHGVVLWALAQIVLSWLSDKLVPVVVHFKIFQSLTPVQNVQHYIRRLSAAHLRQTAAYLLAKLVCPTILTVDCVKTVPLVNTRPSEVYACHVLTIQLRPAEAP